MKELQENNIINDLKGNINFAFGEMYKKYFPVVNRFVINNSGSEADAQDVFQDTMLVLVEKLRKDDFVLTASLKTYIMAIAKHLWFKKIRDAVQVVELSESQNQSFFEEIEQSIEHEKTYSDKLQYYMTKITDHCNRLLHDIFFKNKPIEEIQKQYGYSTKHNAQNQKHKCVEQIRKVKEQENEKNR